MIRYQILHGVKLTGATGLPVINITPEGRAMGSVPGWRVLLDPAYASPTSIRNRADGTVAMPDIPLVFGTFDNGAPCLEITGQRVQANTAVNKDAWSFFGVMQVTPGEQAELVRSFDTLPGELALRMGFNPTATSAVIREGQSTPRLSQSGDYANVALLMIFTFSTRDGLRIFRDGSLLASQPTDKRPLTDGDGAGEWTFFEEQFTGKVGMCGLLDIDLGWPEHAGYRRAIERFLMDKYGIG